MYMYHSFFILSSVDGHPGYFHVLAIVNSAAIMNIAVHVSFSIWASSGYMHSSGISGSCGGFIPSGISILLALVAVSIYISTICIFQFWFSQVICLVVGLLGHMVVLFLVIQGISILSSIVAVSVYISTNSERGFLFLYTLSIIYYL